MKATLLALFVFSCLMVSCSDPSEAVINVTSTTGGHRLMGGSTSPVVTETTSIKVSEIDWRKDNGVWEGRAWTGRGKRWKPADKEAGEAIEAYQNRD
jgi:hypothetical protein